MKEKFQNKLVRFWGESVLKMVIVVCKKEFIIFREGNNVKNVKKRFEGKQKSVK